LDLPAAKGGRSAAGVQPAGNTRFEFVLSNLADLDKIPIWQHGMAASLKTMRFGFADSVSTS
jgi:hypothetical protein